MSGRREVNWETLDKQKFFVYGATLFTGLTGALYPLSVVKTRMMAIEDSHRGLKGAYLTGRDVFHQDGIRGLYRGFGTVLSGMIPARMIYLGSLELSKAATTRTLHSYSNLSEPAIAGVSSFVAGGAASLAGQLVLVPVDVVSQRLMIQDKKPGLAYMDAASNPSTASNSTSTTSTSTGTGKPVQGQRPARIGGFQLASSIIRQEGIKGLYRGFGASVVTFVPSSSIWWASYGAWQSIIWSQMNGTRGQHTASEAELLTVQIVSGVLTGCTAATLSNPLDVIKTRIQTGERLDAMGNRPTWLATAKQLARKEGVSGFYRGVQARMTSMSVWGTSMVTAYEFLKRLCALPPKEQP